MEEKLKSALKKIHWSLAFKALISGLAWVYLPWWLSLFVLLGIYFVPLFQTKRLFLPFLMSLILGWILPENLFSGALMAFQMYLILGIKDFIFINRQGAMQVLAVLFLAESGTAVYFAPDNWLFSSLFYGVLFGLVYYFASSKVIDAYLDEQRRGEKKVLLILAFFLIQIAFALNFLPIAATYKSLLLILSSLIFFEWQKLIFSRELSKNRIISYSVFFLGLAVLVFTAVSWGL